MRAYLATPDLPAANSALAEWRSAVSKESPQRSELTGDIALSEGNAPAALQAWLMAIRQRPKNPRLLHKLAAADRASHQWTAEDAMLTRILVVQDNAATRMLRALCRRHLHRWSEALDDVRRAQQLGALDNEAARATQLFGRLEKFLPSIRELDAQIALSPEDDELVTDRAVLFLRSEDGELALEDAEAAAKITPWAMRPRLVAAIAQQKLGHNEEAERLGLILPFGSEALTPDFLETIARLDSEISVEKNNAELYIARAWQLNEIGQPVLALEDAQTAMEKASASAGACLESSYALAKLGRADEAYSQIKRATELDEKFPTAWDYRGELEMAHADYAAAVDSLTHALGTTPSRAILQKREECYVKLGLLLKAEEDHRLMETLR